MIDPSAFVIGYMFWVGVITLAAQGIGYFLANPCTNPNQQ